MQMEVSDQNYGTLLGSTSVTIVPTCIINFVFAVRSVLVSVMVFAFAFAFAARHVKVLAVAIELFLILLSPPLEGST